MEKGKPERISWSIIGGKLGVSGWLSKRKDKLPITKAYIESKKESIAEFQIRKIKWAVEQLGESGGTVTEWGILEKSGVKKRYIGEIKNEVNEILIEKGYWDIF